MPDKRAKAGEAPAAPGERHGRDLAKVNEKLRELVASLRTEQERLAESRTAHPALTPPPAAQPASAPHDPSSAVDLEKRRLSAELALAREAVEHAGAERERLQARLAEIELENQRICDEYVAIQEHASEVSQLFVSLDRLHGSVSLSDAFVALQEIVINVVGSEEFAVFEVRGDRLALVHSFGVDAARLRELPLARGAIGRAATSGALYVSGRDGAPAPEDLDLTACVPLRLGDRSWGVLAIFRLLGHKPGLGESDQTVFDLLASHAGLALHFRALHERAVAAG
jgi:hypothetical protein